MQSSYPLGVHRPGPVLSTVSNAGDLNVGSIVSSRASGVFRDVYAPTAVARVCHQMLRLRLGRQFMPNGAPGSRTPAPPALNLRRPVISAECAGCRRQSSVTHGLRRSSECYPMASSETEYTVRHEHAPGSENTLSGLPDRRIHGLRPARASSAERIAWLPIHWAFRPFVRPSVQYCRSALCRMLAITTCNVRPGRRQSLSSHTLHVCRTGAMCIPAEWRARQDSNLRPQA